MTDLIVNLKDTSKLHEFLKEKGGEFCVKIVLQVILIKIPAKEEKIVIFKWTGLTKFSGLIYFQ